ncbi:protein cornichon homolog 4-like [Liolophura sinensis]|uniref:protein cornichon homolog 4-like n=1 Tax=Liolophura sinensis TaxID=3198878 RepID=UPI00315981E2
MGVDAPLFIFALLDGAALLFVVVYFIITLSDLECDYINATSCCDKLNKWIFPELLANCAVTFLLLVTGHWLIFLLNSPQTAWVVYKFFTKPSGNIGVFDPTEIHNRNTLKNHMKECMAKLGFHLIFFFIYLYCMIIALIKGEVG